MINNYILGLFATDGSLHKYKFKSKNKISYSITLEMKDLDIIEKVANYFNLFVKSRERTIKNKKHIFYKVELGVESAKLYAPQLKNNKELLFDYFIKLSRDEQNNFIRGAFDGDGGICKKKPQGYRCYICANTKDNLDKIYEYWFNQNKIIYSKYYDKRGKGAYNYNIGKQSEIKKVAKLIYDKKDLYLERKFKIYNGFLSIER